MKEGGKVGGCRDGNTIRNITCRRLFNTAQQEELDAALWCVMERVARRSWLLVSGNSRGGITDDKVEFRFDSKPLPAVVSSAPSTLSTNNKPPTPIASMSVFNATQNAMPCYARCHPSHPQASQTNANIIQLRVDDNHVDIPSKPTPFNATLMSFVGITQKNSPHICHRNVSRMSRTETSRSCLPNAALICTGNAHNRHKFFRRRCRMRAE